MDDVIEKAKAELREAEHKYAECINDCSEFADKARMASNALFKHQIQSKQLFEKVVACRQELRRLTCVGPNNLEGIYT